MKAAVRLGPNYNGNFKVYRNTNFEELQNLFDITQKLILNVLKFTYGVDNDTVAFSPWVLIKCSICWQDTRSQFTSVQYSLITARNAHSMRLAQDQAWFASIFVPQNKCCHLVCHVSHPWLFCHAPSSMSTSSSSPTYPTTQLEHSVHPASLGRQVAPSRITLAWRPAEWRKPAHNNSHSICLHHQTLTRTPWTAQENDSRHMTHSHIICAQLVCRVLWWILFAG